MKATEKILVTGITGSVSSLVARQLFDRKFQLRVSSRNPERSAFNRNYDSVILDLEKPESFRPALKGVTSIFLYAHGDGLSEFLDEARQCGVRHIVLLSSIAVSNDDPEDFNAKSHKLIEDRVKASGISWTFLRPGSFASNILRSWKDQIRFGRTIKIAYPHATLAPIHEQDIADVAVIALTDDRYRDQILSLTGPQSLSQTEQAEIISDVTGTFIKIEELTPEEAKIAMSRYLPEVYADIQLKLLQKNDGIPALVTQTVRDVTGHEARSFREWVTDHITEFK